MIKMGVMGRFSKHGGQGLYARPFDKLRVTEPLCLSDFHLRILAFYNATSLIHSHKNLYLGIISIL